MVRPLGILVRFVATAVVGGVMVAVPVAATADEPPACAPLPLATWGAPLPAAGVELVQPGSTVCFTFTTGPEGNYYVRSSQPSVVGGQLTTRLVDASGSTRLGGASSTFEFDRAYLDAGAEFTIEVTNSRSVQLQAQVGVFRADDADGCVPYAGSTGWHDAEANDVTLESPGEVACQTFEVAPNVDEPSARSNWLLVTDAPGGLNGRGETSSGNFSTSAPGRYSLWAQGGSRACGVSSSAGTVNGTCDLRAGRSYQIYSYDERGHAHAPVTVPQTTHLWIRGIADDDSCDPSIDDTVSPRSALADRTLASSTMTIRHDYGGRECFISRLGQGNRVQVNLTGPTQFPNLNWSLVDADGMNQTGYFEGSTRTSCGTDGGCLLRGRPPYRLLVEGDAGLAYKVGMRRLSEPVGCQTVPTITTGFEIPTDILDSQGSVRCYRFRAGAGDRMDLIADHPDAPATTYGVTVYDAAGNLIRAESNGGSVHTFPEDGDYTVQVRPGSSAPGPFQLHGTCLTVPCGPFGVAVVANPSVGAGSVTLRLEGAGLVDGTAIAVRQGGVEIPGVVRSRGADHRAVDVIVDLSGRSGTWDVVARLGTKEKVLGGAVEILATSWPAALKTTVSGPVDPTTGDSAFVAGRTHRLTVTVENSGDFDAIAAPVFLTGLPVDSVVEPMFAMETISEAGDIVPFDPADPFTYQGAEESGAMIFINRLGPGAVETLDFDVTTPVGSGEHTLSVSSGACDLTRMDADASQGARFGGFVAKAAGGGGCASALVDLFKFLIPGSSCAAALSSVVDAWSQDLTRLSDPDGSWFPSPGTLLNRSIAAQGDGAGCMADVAAKPLKAAGEILDAIGKASDAAGIPANLRNALEKCFPDKEEDSDPEETDTEAPNPFAVPPANYQRPAWGGNPLPRYPVSSLDPNAIVGPGGAGPDRAVRGDGRHTYRVYFENDAGASSPAQEVRVVSQLDPDVYDLSTLRFGRVAFGQTAWLPAQDSAALHERLDVVGDQPLQVQVDATVAAGGELSWHFGTLDPVTSASPPDSPFLGFLPPNVDGTEGQGVVQYSVALKENPTGTVVENSAEIVFDLNEPIRTNTWTNLVDRDTPTASVTAPDTASGPFEVSWAASDQTSGVARMNVYVATDGGDYELWQDGVQPGSATYPGEPGHTYSFGAIAWDWVAHRSESADPPGPTTTVDVEPDPEPEPEPEGIQQCGGSGRGALAAARVPGDRWHVRRRRLGRDLGA